MFLARLDNHLSKFHRGITRAMNDRLPRPLETSQLLVSCPLPNCGKTVKYLAKHKKNQHSQKELDNFTRQKKLESNIPCPSQESVHMQELSGSLNVEGGQGLDNFKQIPVNSKKIAEKEVAGTTVRGKMSDEDDDGVPDQCAKPTCAAHSTALCITSTASVKRDRNCDYKRSQQTHSGMEHLNLDENTVYSEDKLRFLIHSMTADGLRFFLAFVAREKRSPSCTELTQIFKKFCNSKLCKALFQDNVTFAMLVDIYKSRKVLYSFYRHSQFYPLPENNMIANCLACKMNDNGQCSCPILPISFYLHCRQRRDLSVYPCSKCQKVDGILTHMCLDFYHCKKCNEEYNTSLKYKCHEFLPFS